MVPANKKNSAGLPCCICLYFSCCELWVIWECNIIGSVMIWDVSLTSLMGATKIALGQLAVNQSLYKVPKLERAIIILFVESSGSCRCVKKGIQRYPRPWIQDSTCRQGYQCQGRASKDESTSFVVPSFDRISDHVWGQPERVWMTLPSCRQMGRS